jgi:hypothetical protein
MAAVIVFQCPQTGEDVQTLLNKKQEKGSSRAYETVVCPACKQLHFVDTANGKTLGRRVQQQSRALRLDQERALRLDQEKGSSTPFQRPPYHSALIPGTSTTVAFSEGF